MKYRKTKIMSLGLAVVGSMALAGGQNVFADQYNYDINYVDGEALDSNNVTFLEEGVSFKELLNPAGDDVDSTNASGDWESGYGYMHWGSSSCVPVKYYTVPLNNANQKIDTNLSFTARKGDLEEQVTINQISLYKMPVVTNGKKVGITVNLKTGSIGAMGKIYDNENAPNCVSGKDNTPESGGDQTDPGRIVSVAHLYPSEAQYNGQGNSIPNNGGQVFVKANIKLKRNNEVFKSNELYFGVTDIDRGQSYKILGANGFVKKVNMFAVNNAPLQPETSSYRNRLNIGGNGGNSYIYSQYYESETSRQYGAFDIPGDGIKGATVFSRLDKDIGADIDVIFGYGAAANSSTRFYHKTYTVEYKSINGTVTGIKDEEVLSGGKPVGSTQKPNAHYEFEYWTADVDIELANGEKIAAGTKIYDMKTIQDVIVDRNIVFTAHNKTYTIEYKSDEHGKITGTTEENRNSSEHPGGSTQEPDEDYHFSHWICDKDVELVDGTKIEAGEAMTDEQVEQVKITQDLVFTAIHETKSNTPNTPNAPDAPDTPNTPNTGSLTKDGNNVAPIIGLMVAALASTGFVGYFIRNRKKSIVKLD